MKRAVRMGLTLVFGAYGLIGIAYGASISLPTEPEVIGEPPADLIGEGGRKLGRGQAGTLAAKGHDLSLLDPEPSKLWQNKKYPVRDPESGLKLNDGRVLVFPADGEIVDFIDHDSASRYTYRGRVRSTKIKGQYYRISLSRYTHAMLLRAALMRKMGYFIPAPKFFRQLRVRFKDAQQVDAFIKRAKADSGSDLDSRDWIIDRDDKNFILTLSNSTLEFTLREYYNYHWGTALSAEDAKFAGYLESYNRERAYRGLIVPFVLADVPESVNRYSAKSASYVLGDVSLTHQFARSFSGATWHDVRWATLKTANFTPQDWREIVEFAAFPPEIDELVYRKLMYRVNNLNEMMKVKPKYAPELLELHYTSPSKLIVDGKITRERVDGYPQRFGHGDRESPIKDGDLARYLYIEGISTGIKEALRHINEKLVIRGVEDLAKDRQKDIFNKIINHIQTKPNEILYAKVESWGGPIGSFNVDASRHVTTGTFYDSQAPIQLVDTISAGASVGYFRALDGYTKIFPAAGGNLRFNRNYTHVRPINSIEEGTKVSWMNLLVPKFMNDLGEQLVSGFKVEEVCPKIMAERRKENPDKKDEELTPCRHPLDELMRELRNGEVFTITDSLGVDGFLQGISNIDVLMGIDPLSFMNSFRLSFDIQEAVLWQTQIFRTDKGIQVFFRDFNMGGRGVQFDVNYFLNILSARVSWTDADIKTDAYVIDYTPQVSDLVGKDPKAEEELSDEEKATRAQALADYQEKRESLTAALRYVFLENDPELLQADFINDRFKVAHKINTRESSTKFLPLRDVRFSEGHNVKIQPPAHKDFPDIKPEDQIVEIYSYRIGELKGWDWMGLFSDIIDGLIERSGVISRAGSTNPANSVFGEANWRLITTETDLTTYKDPYPRIGLIQNIWGGWHISRKGFLKILDEIQDRFKDVQLDVPRLIEPEALSTVTDLDFYRITASLSINEKGLNKIRDLLLQPAMAQLDAHPPANPDEIPNWLFPLKILDWTFGTLGRSIDRLVMGRDNFGGKYLPSDRGMYEEVLKILGQGDLEKGTAMYENLCQLNQFPNNGKTNGVAVRDQYTGQYRKKTYFPCLESWMSNLLDLKRRYAESDKRAQTEWLSLTLSYLDGHLPTPYLLEFLGRENYIYSVRINGFRRGDEDGDLEFFSNTSGSPEEAFDNANGIIGLYSRDTGIVFTELYRSNGSFR